MPGLPFAHDTALLTPNELEIKKSLNVLLEWCRDWGVKINVNNSVIMHVRQKRLSRCSSLLTMRRFPWWSSISTWGA